MTHNPPVVLLVDDHQDSLAMYAFGLFAMGFQALTAGNGEDAFERACRFQPDVIVTNERLHDASGLDLTRRLRHDARTQHIGTIVLAGNAMSPADRHASDCDRFVLTPCPPDALALEIQAVLADRRPHL
jgi:CheY-like chemotaxis protein